MSFLPRRASTVPRATPVIVNLLKDGPLTWKQLFEQGSQRLAGDASSASSAGSSSQDINPFASRSHFKSRVLPVLETLGIIKQHAISPVKGGDAAERDELVRFKESRARMTAEERKAAAVARSASTSTASTSQGGRTAKPQTEFVWALAPALRDETTKNGGSSSSIIDNSERLQDYLTSLTSGRGDVVSEVALLKEVDEEVDSLEDAAAAARRRMAGIHPKQVLGKKGWAAKPVNYHLQRAWKREDLDDARVLDSEQVINSSEADLERWKSTRAERVHLNRRRARARIVKENRTQSWWNALQEAKAEGAREAADLDRRGGGGGGAGGVEPERAA